MHANGETLRLSPAQGADRSPGMPSVQDAGCRPVVGYKSSLGLSVWKPWGADPSTASHSARRLPNLRGEVCKRGSLTGDGACLRSWGVPILRREVRKLGSLTGDGTLLRDRAGAPRGATGRHGCRG